MDHKDRTADQTADRKDIEAKPQFSRPYLQISQMLIALGLASVGVMIALPSVLPVFLTNLYLNGFILLVFAFGVLATFWQVWMMFKSANWIVDFTIQNEEQQERAPPQILTPLATLLRSRSSRMQISATSTTSILESVGTRIDEAREITRYVVNLLIFLGLLGTFYGLATTVPALVETIRSLAPQDGEAGTEVFARLMSGLDEQLSGMGVAFASSLLGLAGSLVVGLLELFASHSQNRFYRELEEWLSTITRLGYSTGDNETGGAPSEFGGVVDHLGQQMDALRQMFVQSDESRTAVDGRLGELVDAVQHMTRRMEHEANQDDPTTAVLLRVAEGQERLIGQLASAESGEGIDAESRMRLRSIDVQMLRILEEISAGRQETMAELRTDISALGRVIASLRPKNRRAGNAGIPENLRTPPEG